MEKSLTETERTKETPGDINIKNWVIDIHLHLKWLLDISITTGGQG